MTPEAQNIAIAEACGWERSDDEVKIQSWRHRDGLHHTTTLPDYLNDLNACHEMEKVLTNNQRREYARQLVKVTPLQYETANSNDNNDHRMAVFFVVNATAAQRAEAFLKAKGLWV